MKRIIGIDLGTTNTCAAYVQNGVPRVIPSDKGYNTLPSIVHYADSGATLVGQPAREHIILHPETTLYSTKRLIGRPYAAKTVQELKPFLTYPIVEGEAGLAEVEVRGRRVTPVMVASIILAEIRKYAEAHLGSEANDAVISVPAYFTDGQRQAVKEAGKMAGLNVVRIVNEPTAASLAYGFNRGLQQKILVYDLGGGTFDVSILELDGNVFEVVATGGDTYLGGADFDNRIVEWALTEFAQREQIDLSLDGVVIQRLRAAAEFAKCELSLLMNTELRLPFVAERRGKPVDLVLTLSREVLSRLTKDLVDRTLAVTQQVLTAKRLAVQDIGEVILVGGMTRMPAIQNAIAQYFGRAPRKGVHPDEVVALGAALLGDSLGQIDSLTLLDVLSVPIGVAVPGGKLLRIFQKNQTLPAEQTITLPTGRDDQTRMDVDFFQGEGEHAADAEYLGSLVLDDIPAAKAGEIKVTVQVSLDAEGLMRVKAEDSARKQPRSLSLTVMSSPSALRSVAREKLTSEGVSDPSVASQPGEETGLRGIVRNILGKR